MFELFLIGCTMYDHVSATDRYLQATRMTFDDQYRPDQRSQEAVRVWLRLLSCETVIEQHLRTSLRRDYSVTLPQFDVLAELERAQGPLTMSQLSRELMVSNGNVTGVIDRLEASGLVIRKRASHDKRVQYIDLTARGRNGFRKMARRHAQWLEKLFSGLTIAEMKNLQELLLKTRRSIDA